MPDDPASSCIFPAPTLQSTIFEGDLFPFIGEWCLETEIWLLGVPVVTRMTLLLDPPRGEFSKVYLYVCNP